MCVTSALCHALRCVLLLWCPLDLLLPPQLGQGQDLTTAFWLQVFNASPFAAMKGGLFHSAVPSLTALAVPCSSLTHLEILY